MAPSLQRHLLDRILRGFTLMKHGERETVCRLDYRPQDLLKSLAVALSGTVQHSEVIHAAHQMRQSRG
jgi:hypothetical protein